MVKQIRVMTAGQGLYEITDEVLGIVHASKVNEGLATVFIQHTSASLVIQENADPSAKRDLEQWLNRLVRENDPHFTHIAEGPDDMPSHIKASLTATSIGIPILNGTVCLGTWQGIYVWEHRKSRHQRNVVIHVG